MKKLTIGYVRQKFEKEGYQLLTTKYINNRQRLEYICPKGHRNTIVWNSWQQGDRCAECAGLKKKSIDFVRKEFKKENYELLSTKYINANHKLKYICPKGHIGFIRWTDFHHGIRCAECNGTKRKTIEYVRESFEKEGYQLLSTKYINSRQKLKYICSMGHSKSTTWSDWNQGTKCPICANIQLSGENSPRWKNYTKEEIKQFEGYRENVKQITNHNFRKYHYIINPMEFLRGHMQYHVDHLFTVREAFDNKIPPEIVSSPINLQMLPATENISKGSRSDITKETLYELYHQFEEEIKN